MLINFYCNVSQGQGYSGAGENIAVELEAMGHDVRIFTTKKVIPKNFTPEGMAIVKKPMKVGKVGICFGFPAEFMNMFNPVKIGFTMFETSKLPNGGGAKGRYNTWSGPSGDAISIMNRMNEIWVPSEHNVNLFKDEGVTVPVEKVRLGVNTRLFFDMSKERERTRSRRPYTFLMLGTLTTRKNPGLAITSFMNLFTDRQDVRLLLKTQSGTLAAFNFAGKWNIEIIDSYATIEQVQSYYANADAFVFPSRGEGFGLPPLEAMATGLPTIFSDNTGMSEFANPKVNYPIMCDKTSQALRYPPEWGNVGYWYEPDEMQFRETMRDVFENEDMSREIGKSASKWALENFTYKETAKRMSQLLEKYE